MNEKLTSDGSTTITTSVETNQICPGCKGKGYQMGLDGITITCPMCKGSGVWSKSYYPYYYYHPYDYLDYHNPYYDPSIINGDRIEF